MKESNQENLPPKQSSTASSQKNEPKGQQKAVFHSNQFTISTLPLEHHPRIEDILSATGRLSEALNIQLGKDSYAAHTSMTAFLYPKSGRYRIVLVNIFYDLLYYIDDLFGEDIEGSNVAEQPNLQELMNIWLTGHINGDYYQNVRSPRIKSVCTAMQWVRTKILQTCEPPFFKKLSKLLFEHLRDQLRPDGYTDIPSYIALRRNFSGMYVAIHLTEYCYGCYLTPSIMQQVPSLQVAIDKCADIGGLSNDIFSYPKERHSKFNLINSFLTLKKVKTLDEAIQASIDLVNGCHNDFDEALTKAQVEAQTLSDEDRAKVLEFIEGLTSILSASYHWQLVTQRYRHDEHILQDLKTDSQHQFDAA